MRVKGRVKVKVRVGEWVWNRVRVKVKVKVRVKARVWNRVRVKMRVKVSVRVRVGEEHEGEIGGEVGQGEGCG